MLSCNSPKNENEAHSISTFSNQDSFWVEPKEYTFPVPIDYDSSAWMEINESTHIQLDLRYAGIDNFTKNQIYQCGRCFLRPHVAKALLQVTKELKTKDQGLILYDCYRPVPAQQKLWDIMPNASYVTPPSKGSMHNRGHAVDIGLFDIKSNQVLDMGTDFDYFGKEAHFDFLGVPKDILQRRKDLRHVMERYGFSGIRTEWWHFSMKENVSALSSWEWSCE